MFGFEFANPKYFLLLILLVPMIVWYILNNSGTLINFTKKALFFALYRMNFLFSDKITINIYVPFCRFKIRFFSVLPR